jgi:hypothetical protein
VLPPPSPSTRWQRSWPKGRLRDCALVSACSTSMAALRWLVPWSFRWCSFLRPQTVRYVWVLPVAIHFSSQLCQCRPRGLVRHFLLVASSDFVEVSPNPLYTDMGRPIRITHQNSTLTWFLFGVILAKKNLVCYSGFLDTEYYFYFLLIFLFYF